MATFGSFLPHFQFIVLLAPNTAIGRRRRKKWGVIYNALTKLPVDLAIVRLMDQSGKSYSFGGHR